MIYYILHRPRILEANGMKLSDFPTRDEAMKQADAFVAQNCKDFGHAQEKLDNPEPLMVRFKYVIGHGTKRTWESIDKTELDFEYQAKTAKGLADLTRLTSMMVGDGPGDPSGEGDGIKVESPKFVELVDTKKSLRSFKIKPRL